MTRRFGASNIGLKPGRSRTRLNHAVSPGAAAPENLCNFTLLIVRTATGACHTLFVKVRETPRMLRKFLRDENGATAIEYSLIAGFIALAIIAAVGLTGQRLVQLFESLLDLIRSP